MPAVSVWFVRSALVYLVLGAALGGWLLGAKGGGLPPAPASLRAAHVAFLLFGWLVQCTLGVAHWILPRHARGAERGPPWRPWAVYLGFNAGVIGLAGGPVFAPAGLLVVAATGLALWSFAPRIKAFGVGRIREP